MWGDDNATGGAVYPFAPTLRVKRGDVMRIGLRNNLIRAPGETADMGLRMGSVYKMVDFIALHTHGLHAGARCVLATWQTEGLYPLCSAVAVASIAQVSVGCIMPTVVRWALLL